MDSWFNSKHYFYVPIRIVMSNINTIISNQTKYRTNETYIIYLSERVNFK